MSLTDKHRALVASTCVHHRANQGCAVGVDRDAVTVRDWLTWPRDPCFSPDGRDVPDTCERRQWPTDAEVDETMERYEALADLVDDR